LRNGDDCVRRQVALCLVHGVRMARMVHEGSELSDPWAPRLADQTAI
jgi:hypothetical protein